MPGKENVQRKPVELLQKPEHRSYTIWGYLRGLQSLPRASFPAAMAIEPEQWYTPQGISNVINSLQIYPQDAVYADQKGTKLYGSKPTIQHNVALLQTEGWVTNAQQVKQFITNGYLQFGIVQTHKAGQEEPNGDVNKVEKTDAYSIDPRVRNFALEWFSELAKVVHAYPLLKTSAVFRTRDNNRDIPWQEVIAHADAEQQLLGEAYHPSEHVRTLLNSTGILRLRILEEIAEASRYEPNVHVMIGTLVSALDAPYILIEDQINALEQAGLLSHETGTVGKYQWEDANKIPLPQRLPTHVEEYRAQHTLSTGETLPLKKIARELAALYPELYGSYLTKTNRQQEVFDRRIKKYILHPIKEELPGRLVKLLRKAKQNHPENFYTIKQLCLLLAETYPDVYGFYHSENTTKQKYFERQILDIFQIWQPENKIENNYILKESTTASSHAYVYFTPDQREVNFALVNALRTAEAKADEAVPTNEIIFLPPAEFRQVMKQEHEGITLDIPQQQKQEIITFLFSHALGECTANEIRMHLSTRIKSLNHTQMLLGELEEAGLIRRIKPIGNRRTRTSTHLFTLTEDIHEQLMRSAQLQNEAHEQIETFIARNSTAQADTTLEIKSTEIPSFDPRKILFQTLNPRYMAQYDGRYLETYTLPARETLEKLITDITSLLSGRGIVSVLQQKQYLRRENSQSFSWQTLYLNPHIYVFGTPQGDRAIASILRSIGNITELDTNILFDPTITSPIRLYWKESDAYYFISPIVGREYQINSSNESNAPEHLQLALSEILQNAINEQYEACALAYLPVSDQVKTIIQAAIPKLPRRKDKDVRIIF